MGSLGGHRLHRRIQLEPFHPPMRHLHPNGSRMAPTGPYLLHQIQMRIGRATAANIRIGRRPKRHNRLLQRPPPRNASLQNPNIQTSKDRPHLHLRPRIPVRFPYSLSIPKPPTKHLPAASSSQA
jgi:hypothetical protein